MKHAHRLAIIALSLALLATLCACGQGGSSEPAADTSSIASSTPASSAATSEVTTSATLDPVSNSSLASSGTGKSQMIATYKTVLAGMSKTYIYSLYDIDNNGIPELIVMKGGSEADYEWHVYTYENNSAKFVGSFSGADSYLQLYKCAEGGIYNMQVAMGMESLTKITLKNGKLLETVVYSSKDVGSSSLDNPPGDLPIPHASVTDDSLLNQP